MVGKPSIVDVLETGLRASDMRRKVIANNIANLNTPGFRRNSVKFEEFLAEALDSPTGPSKKDLLELKGKLFKPMNTSINSRGNDVNVEVEMGELIKSSSRHKAYLRMLNKVYKQMEMAMQDRI